MDSVEAFFSLIVSAAQSHSWMYLVAAVLMAATWGARKYLAPKVPWLASDAGGVALALLLAFFGAVVTAGPSAALSWALLATSAKVAVTAMGGYAGLRKLVVPLLRWLMGKVGLGGAAAKIAAAEAAGASAVAKNPAKGAGTPTEIP